MRVTQLEIVLLSFPQQFTLSFYCTAFGDCQQHLGTWGKLGTGLGCRAGSPEHYSFALQAQSHSINPQSGFESFCSLYLGDSSAYSQSRKVFQTALCATYKTPALHNWKQVWTPGHPGTLTQHRAPNCSSLCTTLWCKRELSSSFS